ncbi:MAG: flagellar motor protein MotB [Alphaproteobacteria bacterium]|nr:flagellar motor protein MotB [Alphaproteobacteria bacterium]
MSDDRPIIIKKIKKGGHGGHHGGAWKIAYADFVTAMMAFFLLMWLLNATSEEQKRGIANYFDPITIGERAGGGSGVMMGDSITSTEQTAQSSMGAMTIKESKPQEKGSGGPQAETGKDEEAEEATFQAEQASFESIQKDLQSAVQKDPELKEWLSNLLIDETPEGLRIQIIDQQEKSMFPSGSSKMYDHTKKLLEHVSKIIQKVPNKISISGHTDATPYSTKDYTNWELSSDRANASRRVLEESGLNDTRFLSVVGKESKDPFVKNDPFSPQNRRISIVLMRKKPLPQSKQNMVKALEKKEKI